MSRFGGGRSLFDSDGDDNLSLSGNRSFLSEGLEEEEDNPVQGRTGLASEDGEGVPEEEDAQGLTSRIAQEEEEPEVEGEGLTSITESSIGTLDPESYPPDGPAVVGTLDPDAYPPEGEPTGDWDLQTDDRSIGVINGETIGELDVDTRSIGVIDGETVNDLETDDLALDDNLELAGVDDGGEGSFEGFDF